MTWRKEFINKIPGRHLQDEPISGHTSFRVGGPADLLAMPRDEHALIDAVTFLSERNIPFFILGGGYNLLVSDAGYRGCILKIPPVRDIIFQGETVTVSASTSLFKLVLECAKRGLSGMEKMAGIPGTVGGAVTMNAGAFGTCVADVFRSLRCYAPERGMFTLDSNGIEFSYRESLLQRDHDIIRPNDAEVAVDRLRRVQKERRRARAGQGRGDLSGDDAGLAHARDDDAAGVRDTLQSILDSRKTKHPLNVPSAGSFFKNTRGLPPAGRLIEETGLKGLAVGGAMVSPQHANFVVNTGGATCADILELKDRVTAAVLEKHGITLEPEVRIIL